MPRRTPTPVFSAPRYDIDTLLDVDRTARCSAHEIVFKFLEALDEVPQSPTEVYYRPDSALLYPEIIFLDLMRFDISMGNGFGCSIQDWGLQTFYRGVRALRIINHSRGLLLAESVCATLVENGIPELLTFPDDRYYGWCEDWDKRAFERIDELEPPLFQRFKDLDSQRWDLSHSYWDHHASLAFDDPPLDYSLTEYLSSNRNLLQCREQPLSA